MRMQYDNGKCDVKSDEFRTFICYRGVSVGDEASSFIAESIYKALRNSQFEEVFYAPMYNYNFRNSEPVIKCVKYFIIVLSCDFFKDFFVEEEDGWSVNYSSPTYLEMKAAFSSNCVFCPVFSSEFKWDSLRETVKRLYKIFGEEEFNSRLRYRANPLRWPMNNQVARQRILDWLLKPSVTDTVPAGKQGQLISIGELKEDLVRIHHLVYNRCQYLPLRNLEMDYSAYSALKNVRSKKPGESLFHIPSGYLYGVRFLQKEKNHSFVGKGYYDVRSACGLPSLDFNGNRNTNEADGLNVEKVKNRVNCYVCWPIDFGADQSGEITNIGICGICFGMLLLQSWLKEDRKICNSEYLGGREENIEKCIRGALALLVTLRDYEKQSWMSIWEFRDTGIAGTLNQTTLSLSTLMRCGFLDPHGFGSEENFTDFISPTQIKQLKNRFNYIKESISFLEEDAADSSDSEKMYLWQYIDGKYVKSHSQTCFFFDVLLKYIVRIRQARGCFINDMEDRLFMQSEEKKALQNLRRIINSFQSMCDNWILPDSVNVPHVTNLSRVLYSLSFYVSEMRPFANNDEEIRSDVSTAEHMIEKLVDYLLKFNIEHFELLNRENAYAKEIFERFSYVRRDEWKIPQSDNSDGELYENCSEIIYMNALLTAADFAVKDETMQADIKAKTTSLLKWFRDKYVQRDPTHYYLRIRGKRPADDPVKYPLYALYYYRILLNRYIRLYDTGAEK